ncbi:MAG: DUF4405 domain-containing protein [Thermoanaerobaculales bacterium]|nr:DUF4405 domain-containing protein [Thermoanaerobaculales bacterium]
MALPKFNFRSLISLTLLWMFLALLVSGVVLYIAPSGRIAHWTDWALLGLTKEQWQAVHTLASLVFLVGGLFHLLDLNRRVIWNYLKRSRRPDSPFRMSLLASVVLSITVLAGAVVGLPPFSFVTGLGEWVTESWETPQRSAPAPHAEEWPLRQAVETLGIDPEGARTALEAAGFTVQGSDQTLREMADENGSSPVILYQVLAVAQPGGGRRAGSAESPSRGLGRKSLSDVAQEIGIGCDEAIARLQAQGIEAQAGDSLRELAKRYERSPAELWRVLQVPQ